MSALIPHDFVPAQLLPDDLRATTSSEPPTPMRILYSHDNVANSVSEYLAAKLLAEGYLIYWWAADALQTPDGWYFEYRELQEQYLATTLLAGRIAGGRGVVTIRDGETAIPEYPTRPTSDGRIPGHAEIAIPSITVELGEMRTADALGLGMRERFRARLLMLYGFARDRQEMRWFSEHLGWWFDEDTVIAVVDHEAQTRDPVGDVRVCDPDTDRAVVATGPDATQFEFILNAQLHYEA